jgi:hypothetical protein
MLEIDKNKGFLVSFFEIEKLIEFCWSGLTVSDIGLLYSAIDFHFHSMTDLQRLHIYDKFKKKLLNEKSIYSKDSENVREMLVSRYNPMNYFIINEMINEPIFFFKDEYYIKHNTIFDKDKIITCERKC